MHYLHRHGYPDGSSRYIGYMRVEPQKSYEYKFIVNQEHWVNDHDLTTHGQWGNHLLEVLPQTVFKKSHSNLREVRRLFGRLNQKVGDKYPLIYMENLGCQVIQILRENPLKGTFYTLIVRNSKE